MLPSDGLQGTPEPELDDSDVVEVMTMCRELGVKVFIRMDGHITIRDARTMKQVGTIEFNARLKRHRRQK